MAHRNAKRTALIALGVILVIQFVPLKRDNPPLNPSQTIDTLQPMPASVLAIFHSSCNDCHSNQTRWPWYSRLAPISWLVAHDVHEGRKKMNLSEWGSYSTKKKEDKLELICEQVTNSDMPDGKYTFFHRTARLTEEQRGSVCEWVEDARSNLDSY